MDKFNEDSISEKTKEVHEDLTTKSISKKTHRKQPYTKASTSKGKRTIAKFSKQKESTTLFTYPICSYLEIYTEFTGAPIVSGALYTLLEARDAKLTSLFTKREFQYVTILATYLRAATISNTSKITVIHGLSYLKESISSLLLPDVICKYIEILGQVQVPQSVTVIPFFRQPEEMVRLHGFISPRVYLTREQKREAFGPWSICDSAILKVQSGLSRALKGVLELREVNTSHEGSEELLAAYSDIDGGRVMPRCPFKMDVNLASLGACFRFRDSDVQNHTVGLHLDLVHEAPAVQCDVYLNSWIQKQLKH